MRLTRLALALASVLAFTAVAHADPVTDTFVLTYAGTSVTFMLPADPTSFAVMIPGNDFGIISPYAGTTSGTGEFYFDVFGNFDAELPVGGGPGFFSTTGQGVMFSGTTGAPHFTNGTYNLTSGSYGPATLTILASTPEPPALALFATGIIGLFVVLQRRKISIVSAKVC